MKNTLTEQVKMRMYTLLNRWEKYGKIVKKDMEKYLSGDNISRIQISKDVTLMKETFSQIDTIMKGLK